MLLGGHLALAQCQGQGAADGEPHRPPVHACCIRLMPAHCHGSTAACVLGGSRSTGEVINDNVCGSMRREPLGLASHPSTLGLAGAVQHAGGKAAPRRQGAPQSTDPNNRSSVARQSTAAQRCVALPAFISRRSLMPTQGHLFQQTQLFHQVRSLENAACTVCLMMQPCKKQAGHQGHPGHLKLILHLKLVLC